jgi:predicted negative regulator of RcsB-dependent stress response
MATHLDLEEQEQIDQLKAFWKQYGNLITWLLIAVLAGYAGWMGWNAWKRDQSTKAGALFETLEQAVIAGDADKTATVFGDMQQRYPGTGYAQQAALLTARLQFEKGRADAARGTLTWAAENAMDDEYRALARLRLAGLLLDEKKFDDALKQLEAVKVKEFAPLAADRRGDVLQAQGKKDDAKAAYLEAWKTMDAAVEYRRVVEAKLAALGAAPEPEAPKTASTPGAGK